jgi:hypothetical protein
VLVAAEEEPALTGDGAAEGEAGLVAPRLRPLDALLVEEEVVGVEALVLEVVVGRAVEVVGAALGDELEVAAAGAPRGGVVE